MRTTEEILSKNGYRGYQPILTNVLIEFTIEAIKEDRENLYNKVTFTRNSDGDVIIDKDSIINAPNIVLE